MHTLLQRFIPPIVYFISIYLYFFDLFSNKVSFLLVLITRSAGWITEHLLVFFSSVAYL